MFAGIREVRCVNCETLPCTPYGGSFDCCNRIPHTWHVATLPAVYTGWMSDRYHMIRSSRGCEQRVDGARNIGKYD